MREKFVLQLGWFVNPETEKLQIRASGDRIAEMLERNNIKTFSSSYKRSRIARLYDTLFTIIAKRKQFEVAIVPLFGTWPSFLWQEIITRLLKLFKKKIILRILGGSIPGRVNRGAKRFFHSLNRADILIAPSEYLSDYFNEKGFHVQIIENPINLSEYRFHAKEFIRPRILWMRAFTDIYNPAMAVRVAKKLAERYKDFQMVMAGKNGPLTQSIKKMTEEAGLSGKIIFPGYITMKEKLRFANDCDIYICTNKLDNAPVSLIEFMALGLPVVSVNVGGIPYMITDMENGLLVKKDDDEAMFQQIMRLINDQELARSISRNAYQYAQKYDEKNIIYKWKSLMNDINATNKNLKDEKSLAN